MTNIFKKIKTVVFNENAVTDARLELETTTREMLKYQTVVENYTAQVSACHRRINRLQKFLQTAGVPVSNVEMEKVDGE